MKDKRIESIKKLALEMLETAKEFIQEQAKGHSESALKEVLAFDKETLPTYINKYNTMKLNIKIAKAILNGEDVTKNPDFVMQSLYDCAFDVDDYKAIGVNDGILLTLSQIFNKLGMHKKALEAISWGYSID
jgi:hypothetical protein